MEKLPSRIKENLWHIISALLAAVSFVFLFLPLLLKIDVLNELIQSTSIGPFVGLTALIIIILIYSWERLQNFWERYRNTYKLEKPPFIYHNSFVSSFTVSIYLSLLIAQSSLYFIWLPMLIVIIIVIAFKFISGYYSKKEEQTNNPKVGNDKTQEESSLNHDEPIKYQKEDSLGREKFIHDFCGQIVNLPFKESFVFGLYGSWGEGKTSVINLLKNKLATNGVILVVDFDPWYYKDEDAILTGFYSEIEQTINKKFVFPNFKNTLTKYQKLTSAVLSKTGFDFDFLYAEESVKDLMQRIETNISDVCSKKMIIFIDDIDRLQPKEVALIFKLVRLNAKFKNTVFILSFDPIVIQRYFKEELNSDPEFLDKIVQAPVHLPKIEKERLEDVLRGEIKRLLNNGEDRRKFFDEFNKRYCKYTIKPIKTLRHVKRYVNGLSLTLPVINRKEVYLYDFFIIEIIRIFYPKVYRDIWLHREYYVNSDIWHNSDRDEKARMEDEVFKHFKDICNNEKEPETLLIDIFFDKRMDMNNKKIVFQPNSKDSDSAKKLIRDPQSFETYFMVRMFNAINGVIPSSDIDIEAKIEEQLPDQENPK
ncbi:KAP family P-loop domain protein [Candidatus Magnetoovum chiemensis]|nr:KAP family P-loop domain protein [Candidatus Magnetoovum chiemensis]